MSMMRGTRLQWMIRRVGKTAGSAEQEEWIAIAVY